MAITSGLFGQLRTHGASHINTWHDGERWHLVVIVTEKAAARLGVRMRALELYTDDLFATPELLMRAMIRYISGIDPLPEFWRGDAEPLNGQDGKLRRLVLDHAGDAATDFAYYDRKNAEGLTLAMLKDALDRGVVSEDDIVLAFSRQLRSQLSS